MVRDPRIDPQGITRTMTKELRARLGAAAPAPRQQQRPGFPTLENK